MSLPKQLVRMALRLGIAGICLTQTASATAQEPLFPWCPPTGHSAPATPSRPNPPYQTLARPQHSTGQLEPVSELPAKKSYAYGWFGSNPTPAWGRHFGYSRNFTQWTQR